MKKLIKGIFKAAGFDIRRIQNIKKPSGGEYQSEFTTSDAISRCVDRGVKVNTVIDIGASDGRWSVQCNKHFPNAKYHLIEAQGDHEPGIKQTIAQHPNISYVLAAAGSSVGDIYFNNETLFGGQASLVPIPNSVRVKMTTVDHEVKENKFSGPFLVKLDTHGFEVPILEGAKETLRQASLVIIEVYNFQLAKDSLKFFEMCAYMEKLGFSCIEVADLMLRQHDAAFWQMDLFFMPSSSKEFKHNSYL